MKGADTQATSCSLSLMSQARNKGKVLVVVEDLPHMHEDKHCLEVSTFSAGPLSGMHSCACGCMNLARSTCVCMCWTCCVHMSTCTLDGMYADQMEKSIHASMTT